MILSLSACIYPFEADLDGVVDNRLVIDGDIVVGGETMVAVSRLSPLTGMLSADKLYPSVSVCVEEKGGSKYDGARYAAGKYSVDTRKLDPDGTFRMVVTNLEDGRRYVSSWQKCLHSPAIISLFHELKDDSVDLCASIQARDDAGHFKVTFEETWEYSADYRPDWMFDPEAATKVKPGMDPEDPSRIYRKPYASENYYYCWASAKPLEFQLSTVEGLQSTVIDKLIYKNIARTNLKMQIMYSSLVTVSPLSKDAYEFLDNMQRVSNLSGSLFSPVPSDVRGNLRCESDTSEFVIGFVSVYQVAQQRFFLDCEKNKVYIKNYDPSSFLFLPVADEDEKYNFLQQYESGQRPVYTVIRDDTPSKTNMYWAPRRCTDCRALGGNKIKPSYWPNDHE